MRSVGPDRLLASSIGLAAVLAAVLATATPALSADLKDPLTPLLTAKGSILCFGRDYAPEHLAQHPKQTTKALLLAFREEGWVSIVLSPRTGTPKRIAASCGWRQGAGIDTSDRKMFPNFGKPAGFDCIVVVTASSAEEGGALLIDPAQDAKSLTLFLQSPITAFDDKRRSLTLDPEDRTFALTRLDPKACAALKPLTE